ncbi:MAG: hypothetical protein SGI83_13870 [Bacteroidota bacterium]|nr:hypothetical protein [Bacteroidota bacterium]
MNSSDAILRFTYRPLELYWQGKKIAKIQSKLLIATFTLTMGLAFINHTGFISIPNLFGQIHFLQAIEISFSLLLFFEMISLVFVIPQSIANSIGKQFEILSLVLLRSSFKEFSHFDFQIPVQDQLPSVYKMISDGVGSSILFFLLSFYYKIQQHRSVTSPTDKLQFIILKQYIALLVFISLFFLEINDIYNFINTGMWVQSIDQFYMILIFADLLFMLVAFKYTLHYPDVFRYAAFVLVTVFIRLSLMAPVYYNTLLALFAVLFAIAVAHGHNIFSQGRLNYLTKRNNTLT